MVILIRMKWRRVVRISCESWVMSCVRHCDEWFQIFAFESDSRVRVGPSGVSRRRNEISDLVVSCFMRGTVHFWMF